MGLGMRAITPIRREGGKVLQLIDYFMALIKVGFIVDQNFL